MKALEIKLVEKVSNVVYSFFRSKNETFIKNVVSFDNGYQDTLDSIKNMLANAKVFTTYKEEVAFLKSWSNKKRLEFINNNIEHLDFVHL